MFYSHTFLARKGPLGTVWCAAHVQHRLRKSHYTSTHIPTTVDRIMCPEVPIALRMSGHLLLGVARIYSKKIDYLYQDYNALLLEISKAFDASTDVNLQNDASHAKSDDVTLPSPNKFALDHLDLEEFLDNHCKSLEDITVTDQIPVGRDLYIAVNISEPSDSTHLVDAPGSWPVPMLEDSPPSPMDTSAGVHDPGPSNRLGVNEMLHEDSIPEFERMRDAVHSDFMVDPPIVFDREDDVLEPDPVLKELMRVKDKDTPVVEEMSVSGGKSIPQWENQEPGSIPESIPEFERMRDAVHSDFMVYTPIFPDREDDVLEPDMVLMELMRVKNKDIPVMEEMLVSGGKSILLQENLEPLTPSEPISFALRLPVLAIRPSSPVKQPTHRKRKRLFDEERVLTNEFMKKAIEDSNDLKRKRKYWCCSSLGWWRLNKKQKQERIFLEPLITGLSDDLCSIFNKDYISAKHHLAREEAHPEPNVAQPPSPVNDLDMEIERPQNFECRAEPNNIMSELMSSSPNRLLSSPPRRDDFTPATSNGFGSQSNQVDVTFGTGALPTPDFAGSTGSRTSEMETTLTLSIEQPGFNNSGLYRIPELDNNGELTFLEEEDRTPSAVRRTPEVEYSGKQRGTAEVDSLSVRARAVAQYLRKKSLGIPISGDDDGEYLSLNTILEGKKRKICARMFFETLVLKNCGLVQVKQDETYGDILLKVTDKLSKEQFSN